MTFSTPAAARPQFQVGLFEAAGIGGGFGNTGFRGLRVDSHYSQSSIKAWVGARSRAPRRLLQEDE